MFDRNAFRTTASKFKALPFFRPAAVAGGSVALLAAPQLAHAQAAGADPLATLVAGVSFTTLETDVATIGVTLAALYAIYVGVRWILRMVRSA